MAALLAGPAALAAPEDAAALPRAGVLVPGRSLGGVVIGMTKREVRQAWGTRFGRCRDCAAETWYFTYAPFEPQGAGVVFRRGRAAQVFTLWQPEGWRTTRGLRLGAAESEIADAYGALVRRHCTGYTALLLTTGRVQSSLYVYDGELWGFGLTRRGSSPCL